MKHQFLILLCLLLFIKSYTKAQLQLTALDSLFVTSIDQFYKNAENTKSEIWEGMQISPVYIMKFIDLDGNYQA